MYIANITCFSRNFGIVVFAKKEKNFIINDKNK